MCCCCRCRCYVLLLSLQVLCVAVVALGVVCVAVIAAGALCVAVAAAGVLYVAAAHVLFVDFVPEGITPLMVSTVAGAEDTAALLLSLGGHPNSTNVLNATALQLAHLCHHDNLIKLLYPVTDVNKMNTSESTTMTTENQHFLLVLENTLYFNRKL